MTEDSGGIISQADSIESSLDKTVEGKLLWKARGLPRRSGISTPPPIPDRAWFEGLFSTSPAKRLVNLELEYVLRELIPFGKEFRYRSAGLGWTSCRSNPKQFVPRAVARGSADQFR
jgi:hypothetical protein